jgi:hypothetical protein
MAVYQVSTFSSHPLAAPEDPMNFDRLLVTAAIYDEQLDFGFSCKYTPCGFAYTVMITGSFYLESSVNRVSWASYTFLHIFFT